MRRSRGRPTIETISARAGVSTSTVSRALHGDLRISKARREAITAIAEEIGYFPNANARSLITSRSGLIGFIMGDVGNPFYNELLEELVWRAAERNLKIMVLHVGRKPLADATIGALLQYQMDGCIISSLELTSKAAEVCERNNVPLVMINRVPRTSGAAVSCDNHEGATQIVRLLLDAGHRRIAIVEGTKNASTSEDRVAGANAELDQWGLEAIAVDYGGSTYQEGYAAAQRLLRARNRPDAIFAVNDIMAFGVIDAARHLGLTVPHDISIAGFDDVEQASWPAYDLTTVAQPTGAMVERALDHMESRIGNPEMIDEQSFIRGALKVRTSVLLQKENRAP